MYKPRDTPLEFCWYQYFFIRNQQILLYQEIQIDCILIHFHTVIILMMATKTATLGLLKRPEAYNFIKKETLAQVFSCEFCRISKNTFFTEHVWTTASVIHSTFTTLLLASTTCITYSVKFKREMYILYCYQMFLVF